jgi:prophage regulatory protein
MANEALLRLPEVIRRTGLSRSSIYSAIAKKEFPAPIALGARSVAWVESEVATFIEARISESRKRAA